MKKTIVFTGGGTLGHVMPNLYLIEELKNDYDIFYVGSNGIEKETASKVADFYPIPAIKLERGKIIKNLKIPFVLINSIFKAKKALKVIKPDVIFSKGGYVALPVCIAGKMLKIPIIAHESDYSFGLANKIILKLCNKMCVNFKNLASSNKKITYTGPIFSNEFLTETKNKTSLTLHANKPTLLVVGGSLGSQKINEAFLPIVKDLIKDFNIIHLTGKGNLKLKSFDNYNAFEMRTDMVNLYNIADFVLGRSGAGVTAECFYKKLPMLLVPLENKSSRGDQFLNAKYYKTLGVANIIHETNLNPTFLYDKIIEFSKDLATFKNVYKTLEQTNGKEKVLKLITQYANNNTNK